METIKDVGKFISWWWNKLDEPSKFFLPLLILILLSPVGLLIFGPMTGLSFLMLAFIYVIGKFILMLCYAIVEQWHKFRDEKDMESQEIINRLSGSTEDTNMDEDSARERAKVILAKLRARTSP